MNDEQIREFLEVLDRGLDRGFKLVAAAIRENPGTAPPPKKDGWKGDPASEKQLSLMSKQRIPFSEPITKGKASDLIDGFFKNKKRG